MGGGIALGHVMQSGAADPVESALLRADAFRRTSQRRENASSPGGRTLWQISAAGASQAPTERPKDVRYGSGFCSPEHFDTRLLRPFEDFSFRYFQKR
tara:strand:+ start:6318 stop:6611 length:294 start_codon:yes stop_codon:yes gene_type:complete